MALARQLRRHRPDNGLTLSQLELLGDVNRAGVTTPAEVAARLQVRVQSLTDSINELEARGLISRRPDDADRRRQLIELTADGLDAADCATAPSATPGCPTTMRDHLTELEFNLLMLTAPVLRKLADADHAGTISAVTPEEWIAHDPDPVTAAELAACDADELAARFARPLTFGTAGLRGPVRGGPDAMNVAVVTAGHLGGGHRCSRDRGLGGSTVVVGRDARHGSDAFASAAAEVLAAQGFSVIALPHPVPTPGGRLRGPAHRRRSRRPDHRLAQPGRRQRLQGVLRRRPADRPPDRPGDRGGDRRRPARRRDPPAAGHPGRDRLVDATSNARPPCAARTGSVRVALTAMHGVGGEFALRALRAGRLRRRARRRKPIRARPGLPDGGVPQSRRARRHRRAAGAGRTRRRRHRHRAGSRRRPLRGGHSHRSPVGGCCPATKPVGCWAITSSRQRRRRRRHRGGQQRGLLPAARRDRRRPRRPPCADPDRVQMAGPGRRRHARRAPWSTPTRRPSATASTRPPCATRTASAPRCWSAIWWPRLRHKGIRCRMRSIDWRAPRCAHHRSAVPPRRRPGRGRGDDGAAADATAHRTGRFRRHRQRSAAQPSAPTP